ncbi:MAG: NAD-dependent deacylase [Anaerolineales bacterium]
MAELSKQLEAAAAHLRQARSAVALTGAGVSTPSGIPDFRGSASSLWAHDNASEVASSLTFRYEPERFFTWVRPLARLMRQAQPNSAHRALAALEAQGILHTLITQNIDDLHRRAGSQHVLEIHGSLRTATCIRCRALWPAGDALLRLIETGALPACPTCGGLLKPDVTLMGEELPVGVLRAAERAALGCDVMLVAGTSLEVMPASELPLLALEAGARVIVVNLQPTFVDDRAALVVRGDVAEVLPRLAAAVMGRSGE